VAARSARNRISRWSVRPRLRETASAGGGAGADAVGEDEGWGWRGRDWDDLWVGLRFGGLALWILAPPGKKKTQQQKSRIHTDMSPVVADGLIYALHYDPYYDSYDDPPPLIPHGDSYRVSYRATGHEFPPRAQRLTERLATTAA